MWFKSHIFNNTQWKTQWRKKSILKDEEGKEKKVQKLLSRRATTKKNCTDKADGLFTMTSVKQHTLKKTAHHLTSKHLAQCEVICPKRNNLGLDPHLEHNAWTTSTWLTLSGVQWAEISLSHLSKANNSVITVPLWTDLDRNPLWMICFITCGCLKGWYSAKLEIFQKCVQISSEDILNNEGR